MISSLVCVSVKETEMYFSNPHFRGEETEA